MIIRGFYDKVNGYFYVLAYLHVDGKSYRVHLMVDSGASVTALLDRDALRIFGSDLRRLDKASKNLVGIGGFADTYCVSNVKLELVDSIDDTVRHQVNLEKLYVVTHHKHFRGEEWKKVTQMPSLLGRDVLFKANRIVFHPRSEPPSVEIEFPDET